MKKRILNRGWGDGKAVEAFAQRRKKDHSNCSLGFRPLLENEPAFLFIRRWASDPEVRASFSMLFNALLPYLKVAVENTTESDDKGISIEANFGRIIIKPK